jgi:hypothetical protein
MGPSTRSSRAGKSCRSLRWQLQEARKRTSPGATPEGGGTHTVGTFDLGGFRPHRGRLTYRAQKPRIGPVTRSFFEIARLARLGGHDAGSRLPTGARHLFREHCPATLDPMSLAASTLPELACAEREGTPGVDRPHPRFRVVREEGRRELGGSVAAEPHPSITPVPTAHMNEPSSDHAPVVATFLCEPVLSGCTRIALAFAASSLTTKTVCSRSRVPFAPRGRFLARSAVTAA